MIEGESRRVGIQVWGLQWRYFATTHDLDWIGHDEIDAKLRLILVHGDLTSSLGRRGQWTRSSSSNMSIVYFSRVKLPSAGGGKQEKDVSLFLLSSSSSSKNSRISTHTHLRIARHSHFFSLPFGRLEVFLVRLSGDCFLHARKKKENILETELRTVTPRPCTAISFRDSILPWCSRRE